ncbi:MAG: transcriptional regulator [Prevotellaceae bacterium]|nr:transcriptional regulator [Prevotellaceae bacterium]
MTKFDHRSQLPLLFIENKLSLLPSKRGEYLIGSFETFYDFDANPVEIEKIEFPSFLESLDYRNITSEATAINCAFVSKILQDFTGEANLFPTVSGRMSSSSFDFNINSAQGLFKFSVENSQVEIDGGFEGDHSLNLIEAKNYIADDFIVRQLYYPYKLWTNKVSKKIRPVFLTYTNGIFHLREYAFDDINHYNSLHLINQKKYVIQEPVNIEIIQQIIETVEIQREPEISFPQADSFERVINLCELLMQKGFISKEEITYSYNFDYRQTNYYSSAGKYLGLIDSIQKNGQAICFLTEKGKRIFTLSFYDRQIEFIKIILSHLVFKKTLKICFENGEMPCKNEIVEIMKKSKLYNIGSDSTYFRRASTVTGWINWIVNQIEE